MSRKTRSILKFTAVLLVLLSVLIQLNYVSIVFIDPYSYWLAIVGFGLLLIASR